MSGISSTELLILMGSILAAVIGGAIYLVDIILKDIQAKVSRQIQETNQEIANINSQLEVIKQSDFSPEEKKLRLRLLQKRLEELQAKPQKQPKYINLFPISILLVISGLFIFLVTIIASIATKSLKPAPTATYTPTLTEMPTFTLSSTNTLTLTPTLTFTPTPVCPYRGATDNETIVNLINAEAAAANQKSMQIMLSIFDPNANFTDYVKNPPQTWVGPVARYQNDAFKQYEYKDVVHIDIAPVGLGISGSTAWYVSGSTGSYRLIGSADWTAMNNGSKVSKTPPATKYGSEHWILQKNDLGCWVIRQMDFDAGHIRFP